MNGTFKNEIPLKNIPVAPCLCMQYKKGGYRDEYNLYGVLGNI